MILTFKCKSPTDGPLLQLDIRTIAAENGRRLQARILEDGLVGQLITSATPYEHHQFFAALHRLLDEHVHRGYYLVSAKE